MTHIILVAGLHNSGTSALAGALDKLGVDMGLMTADRSASHPPHNPHGQYEDHEGVQLLHTIVGNWRHPRFFGLINDTVQRVLDYAHLRSEDAPVWGFKDPRLCYCAGSIAQLLKEEGYEVSVVFSERNFDTCANHLAVREGLPPFVAAHIQAGYATASEVTAAHCNAFDVPCFVVQYDYLCEDPRRMMENLALCLHLDPTEEQLEIAAAHIQPREPAHASG